MTWFRGLFLALAASVLLAGCGPRATKVPVTPPTAQEQVKSVLQNLAKTGEVTSAIMSAREQLEEMKKTDSAKADALLKELTELESLKDPAAIKAKAQKMLEKL